MTIFENYSLKNHNSFGVDAAARYFAEFDSIEQLHELLQYFAGRNIPKLVFGGGSNILFTKDFPGVVLKNKILGIKISMETDLFVQLKIGAGVVWDDVVKFAVENNYWGIENLSLIPGTAGAAPIQNIGAYGCELKDVFDSADILNINNYGKKNISNNDCEFGYRDSIFKNQFKNEFIITGIILKLSKIKNPNLSYQSLNNKFSNIPLKKIQLRQIREFILETRKSKLPDVTKVGSAGSFFKNPILSKSKFIKLQERFPNIKFNETDGEKFKISAANLIENIGMKGIAFGKTGTYKNHSLIIVNNENATGNEIYEFSQTIKEKIFQKFNIKLIEEVNII